MPQNDRVAHQLNYVLPNRFYVEVEGTVTASFSQCSGLSATMKKNEYAEGGVNEQTRVYLGPLTHGDVTLSRGITDSTVLCDWAMESLEPGRAMSRRNINILLFNLAGELMQCWTLIGAVVTGWKGPQLMANLPQSGATAALEQLVISYEAMYALNQGGGGAIMTVRDAQGYFGSQEAPTRTPAPRPPVPIETRPSAPANLQALPAAPPVPSKTAQQAALEAAAASGLPFCEVCR